MQRGKNKSTVGKTRPSINIRPTLTPHGAVQYEIAYSTYSTEATKWLYNIKVYFLIPWP